MEYKFKGTPGEWEASTYFIGEKAIMGFDIRTYDPWQAICGGYGKIDGNFPSNEEAKANAHLITAAPDLLQLAIIYLKDLNNMPHSPALHARISQVQDVINKALGL